jgi:hypothetical protein
MSLQEAASATSREMFPDWESIKDEARRRISPEAREELDYLISSLEEDYHDAREGLSPPMSLRHLEEEVVSIQDFAVLNAYLTAI